MMGRDLFFLFFSNNDRGINAVEHECRNVVATKRRVGGTEEVYMLHVRE